MITPSVIHNDSIPAAPSGIVEIGDQLLEELAGGFLDGVWNGIKAVGNVIKEGGKMLVGSFKDIGHGFTEIGRKAGKQGRKVWNSIVGK
jgi:hypothetical protein